MLIYYIMEDDTVWLVIFTDTNFQEMDQIWVSEIFAVFLFLQVNDPTT